MAKSNSRKAYDLYCNLPDSVRVHTDKVVRICAKSTKKLRDQKTIEKRGKAHFNAMRKRIHL